MEPRVESGLRWSIILRKALLAITLFYFWWLIPIILLASWGRNCSWRRVAFAPLMIVIFTLKAVLFMSLVLLLRQSANPATVSGLPAIIFPLEYPTLVESEIRIRIARLLKQGDPFGGELREIARERYSIGPDGQDDRLEVRYDPTNGTVSRGDIPVESWSTPTGS